jgi:hypothetical protein
VVDEHEKPSAVQLDINAWERLLDWLEDLEDHALVRGVLPQLRSRPTKYGALRWDEVKAEWDAPDSVSESGN